MQNTEGEICIGSADSEMFLENTLCITKAVRLAPNRQQPASFCRLMHTLTMLPQIEGLRSRQVY